MNILAPSLLGCDFSNLERQIKAVEEAGEEILCAIEDEAELEHVYDVMMQELYSDEDTDEDAE